VSSSAPRGRHSLDRDVLHRGPLPLRHGGRHADGVSGGIHFWWPKITGRMYPEKISQLAAVVTFIGFNFTFFPQFILGTLGMPRRYAAYPPSSRC